MFRNSILKKLFNDIQLVGQYIDRIVTLEKLHDTCFGYSLLATEITYPTYAYGLIYCII